MNYLRRMINLMFHSFIVIYVSYGLALHFGAHVKRVEEPNTSLEAAAALYQYHTSVYYSFNFCIC